MSHEIPRNHVASAGVSRDESGEGTISQDGASAGKLQGHSVMSACDILKAMVDSGQIKQIGGSRTTRYELRKE